MVMATMAPAAPIAGLRLLEFVGVVETAVVATAVLLMLAEAIVEGVTIAVVPVGFEVLMLW